MLKAIFLYVASIKMILMAFYLFSAVVDWRAKALRNHLRMVDLSISITMKINAMSIVFRQWLSYHKIPRFFQSFQKKRDRVRT